MGRKNGSTGRNQRRQKKNSTRKSPDSSSVQDLGSVGTASATASLAASLAESASESTTTLTDHSGLEDFVSADKETAISNLDPIVESTIPESLAAIFSPGKETQAPINTAALEAHTPHVHAVSENSPIEKELQFNTVTSVSELVVPVIEQHEQTIVVTKSIVQGESVSCYENRISETVPSLDNKQIEEIVASHLENVGNLLDNGETFVVEEIFVEKVSAVEKPTIKEISVEEVPTAEVSAVEAPIVEEVPVAETPIAETPIVETPIVKEVSVVETPIVEAPIVETPIVKEVSVVETPIVEAPIVETPIVEAPIVETPIVEAPIVETPIVEAPIVKEVSVVETPIVETPIVETPAAETPAAEIPVSQTQVIKTQASDNSVTVETQNSVAQTEQKIQENSALVASAIVDQAPVKREVSTAESTKDSSEHQSSVYSLTDKSNTLKKKKSVISKVFQKMNKKEKKEKADSLVPETESTATEKQKKRKFWQFWKK